MTDAHDSAAPPPPEPRRFLEGKRGLVIGIANEDSIAYGCARALQSHGAELAVSYLNAKAEPHVRAIAERLGCTLVLPLDITVPGQSEALFGAIAAAWGRLDFVIHAVAFAPARDLHGRVVDCSADGFQLAMRVSCYSLIEVARLAEPLMTGGAIVTMTFYGADKVVPQYGVMGPVKAALQGVVRSLAFELAPRGIRVHAVSAGPVRTRAASGIPDFEGLLADARARTPLGRLVVPDDVGALTAFLVSDGAAALTGDTVFVDGGRHVVA